MHADKSWPNFGLKPTITFAPLIPEPGLDVPVDDGNDGRKADAASGIKRRRGVGGHILHYAHLQTPPTHTQKL